MAGNQEGDAFVELFVDHTKASQIKELGNSIHEIFNVVIEYGKLSWLPWQRGLST